MSLKTGQVLNKRYRIVKHLGQGGFSQVYRAWDLNLGRACAVKENLDTSPEAQKQFYREAQILANLNHPNLARVTDHFSIPGQGQYLVMDYVEGDDLQQMLESAGGPLEEEQVMSWIGQICDALIYLHGHNPPVIHRDIKPANIKITPLGRAVLVDFGIARVYDPSLKTTVGARAVTPSYSPPEQYGQAGTDARSDIYALGATLYTLLTGQAPPESIAISAEQARLVPVRALNPDVSQGAGAAVEQAMRVSPTQRFPSVEEFKRALAGEKTPAKASEEAVAWKRPVILGAGLVGLLLLAAFCFAGWQAVTQVLARPETPPAIPTALPSPAATLDSRTAEVMPTEQPPDLLETAQEQAGDLLETAQAAASQQSAALIETVQAMATQQARELAATAQAYLTQAAQAVVPAATSTEAPPPVPTPFAQGFMACLTKCSADGSNAVSSFSGGTTKIHLRWEYGNIPKGAHYIRAWAMAGQEWVRYDCTWPGPASGVDEITLTEPDGLHSGTWDVTIVVDGQLILNEQVLVDGNWTFWTPAGVFYTCYGKK